VEIELDKYFKRQGGNPPASGLISHECEQPVHFFSILPCSRAPGPDLSESNPPTPADSGKIKKVEGGGSCQPLPSAHSHPPSRRAAPIAQGADGIGSPPSSYARTSRFLSDKAPGPGCHNWHFQRLRSLRSRARLQRIQIRPKTPRNISNA